MSTYVSRKEKLLARLAEMGLDPKRSLGQNFLISDHVISKILFAVKAEAFSSIIEIGPGLGALTDDLIEVAKEKNVPLSLLELDRVFCELWKARIEQVSRDGNGPQIHLREGDALQVDWSELGLSENSLFVSNLPYQISSSIVIERCLQPAGIGRMILMFQREVAQRISARASTPEYGLLTVIAQTFWETATVSDASPGDFFPQPNVSSRVLVFRRRKNVTADFPRAGFLKFAKAAFSHRRKLMSRNLLNEYFRGNGVDLVAIEAVFAKRGLLPTARAEELDPPAFVGLYLAIEAAGLKPPGGA